MATDATTVGGGMQDAIMRILAQRLAQAQLDETRRSNTDELTYRNRALDLQTKLRQDALDEKRNAGIEKTVSMRGIGDAVTEGEFANERTAGVPSSDYQITPGPKVVSMAGFSSLPQGRAGSQIGQPAAPAIEGQDRFTAHNADPLNAPRTISFRGTGAQRDKAKTEERLTSASEAQIQSKIDQLKISAQNAQTAGDAAAARIELAGAQAELARVRAQHVGDAKPLPSNLTDQMAGLNVAEVEGVKSLRLLDQLKQQTGGVDVNDPIDPRWQQFMVTQLKMAPDQWQKADIQQRVAAVNAMLTRGLMGARPSQYIAQMIQQHLPQGDMTPAQLRHVIENVLEQAQERRMEVEGLTGRESGSLSPRSGETYDAYTKASKTATPAGVPAGVKIQRGGRGGN
jgi:hypothetical protein